MAERIHFISGLPRSGSTLLANILAQNPQFWSTPTSPLCASLIGFRDFFWLLPESRAVSEQESAKIIKPMLQGAFNALLMTHEREVIFDKSRSWVQHIEFLERVLPKQTPPKILVCVRNLHAIFASFETLWRSTKDYRVISLERTNQAEFATIEGRMSLLAKPDNVVGGPVNWVRDAVKRGKRKNLHFVDYDLLCDYPDATMKKIYEFLEEELFEHDFENVKQSIHEHDAPYGWGDLHKIREGPVKPSEIKWQQVLTPELIKNYDSDATFWTKL